MLRVPMRDKTSEQMRYVTRLKPFWGLKSPEVVPFESFRDIVSLPTDTSREEAMVRVSFGMSLM